MNKAKDFGKKLAECRRNRNFTQEELANRIGVTPQALSKWENGLSSPDLSLFSSLCEILEMSSDYLLGLSGGKITENGNEEIQDRIWYNLRTCLETLSLIFGEGIVPERISYGLLLEVTKKFVCRGNSLLYLPKIIESIECHLRNNENISTTELIDRVCKDIERKDNFWIKRFS